MRLVSIIQVNHVVHQIKDSNGNVVGEGIDKTEARKDAGFPPAFYSYSGEAKKIAEFDKIFNICCVGFRRRIFTFKFLFNSNHCKSKSCSKFSIK